MCRSGSSSYNRCLHKHILTCNEAQISDQSFHCIVVLRHVILVEPPLDDFLYVLPAPRFFTTVVAENIRNVQTKHTDEGVMRERGCEKLCGRGGNRCGS